MSYSAPEASQLDHIQLPDSSQQSISKPPTFWSLLRDRWEGDYHLRVGYYVLAANIFLYAILLLLVAFTPRGDDFGFVIVSIVSYLMTQIYGIMIWRTKRRTVSLGLLYFASLYVGCFILNLSLPVFATPSLWWGAACMISAGVLAIEPIQDLFKANTHRLYLLCAGLALSVFLHQSIFILNSDTLFGTSLGLLVGGFGIYGFVPALAFISLLAHSVQVLAKSERSPWAFSAGAVVPMVATIIFSIMFFNREREILAIPSSDFKLPQTVQILEHIEADWLSQVVLTHKYRYQFEPGRIEGRSPEGLTHNPLVYWASNPSRDRWRRSRDNSGFAKFFAQTGHGAEEALWSSTGLSTSSIDIQHEVNPATASVRSTYRFEAESELWRQGEAIYTFQLPEGAVVTGSSLVVHGVEQPGRLSTKSKAKEAYKKIVGRERRDPSLVEWRNGNTVSMRVFPITSKLPRSFSIEITAPLQKDGDRTFIAPIGIEGPPTSRAKITRATSADRSVEASIGFQETSSDSRGYRPEVTYVPNHEISTHSYVRDGMVYTLEPAKPNFADRSINRIYIDLTEGWTAVEVKQVLAKAEDLSKGANRSEVGRAKVFGYNGTSIELTEDNLKEAISSAQKRKRSYFPLYAIGEPSTSLLITRNQDLPFKFDAIKGSSWARKIEIWLAKSRTEKSLAHYHIGEDVPKYLQSIGSSRAISSETGDFETLLTRIEDQRYRIYADGPGIVEAFDGNARITALPTDAPNSSGDPALLQLFTYRQSLLTNLLQEPDSIAQEKAFGGARKANAVTPFSSLIVLENDADYARFNIPNVIGPNKVAPPKAGSPPAISVVNGEARPARNLDFAFEQGSGSVPEPHEWALILLSLAILGGMYIRRS